MSDATKRDAVLAEFTQGLVIWEREGETQRRMADEIVRLREGIAILKGYYDDAVKVGTECAEKMRRSERILAALREPSGSVVKAAADATPVSFKNAWLVDAIRAAVAAAEKEVGNGEHHPNTLADLLREAADEIEGSVRHEYGWPDVHPARKLKFDRDMDIVTRLRSAAAEQEVGA